VHALCSPSSVDNKAMALRDDIIRAEDIALYGWPGSDAMRMRVFNMDLRVCTDPSDSTDRGCVSIAVSACVNMGE
jgi:hypothetical protein